MSAEPPTTPAATEPPLQPVIPGRMTASSSRSWVNVLLGVALVVAVGGVAFAVGRVTAPAPAAAFPGGVNGPGGGFIGGPGASGQPGPNGPGGFLTGGITLEGTVASFDGTTLVLRTANGQTVEVTIGSDTEYHEQSAATGSDVTTGSTVQVRVGPQGGGGTGGNLSASDITIVP